MCKFFWMKQIYVKILIDLYLVIEYKHQHGGENLIIKAMFTILIEKAEQPSWAWLVRYEYISNLWLAFILYRLYDSFFHCICSTRYCFILICLKLICTVWTIIAVHTENTNQIQIAGPSAAAHRAGRNSSRRALGHQAHFRAVCIRFANTILPSSSRCHWLRDNHSGFKMWRMRHKVVTWFAHSPKERITTAVCTQLVCPESIHWGRNAIPAAINATPVEGHCPEKGCLTFVPSINQLISGMNTPFRKHINTMSLFKGDFWSIGYSKW